MNIKKELIQAFKGLLGLQFGKVYTDAEIKISDKVVGGKVEMIQADGSLAPVEDGDYVMDNGFAFQVKDGAIISIVGEEPAAVDNASEDELAKQAVNKIPKEEEKQAADVPAEPVVPDTTIADMQSSIDELSARIDALEQANTQMAAEKLEATEAISNFNKIVMELNENIKTLASVPVQFSKTNKSVVAEETKEEKLGDLARLMSGLK